MTILHFLFSSGEIKRTGHQVLFKYVTKLGLVFFSIELKIEENVLTI